jgi:hypothetical protein
MKIAIIGLGILAAFIGTEATAQSASLASTAVIVTPITATTVAPLAFGTISKGATATVSASSTQAAAISLSGDESDNVTVTVPATCTISTTSGVGSGMTVTINRAALLYTPLGNIPANGGAAVNASSGSVTVGLSMDNQGNATNNDGLGQAYIWIGGSVTPAATQQRGAYSGTFTVTAAYSN